MPGVPPIYGQGQEHIIADLSMRLRALETQQQLVFTNALLQAIINTGLSPGSNPPQYGFQLVNPSTGAEVGFFGEDGAGNIALKFRDAAGNVRLQLGLLPSGDYGMEVFDASGNGVEILPQYNIFGGGPYTLSTSGTAALGVSESVPIGASGKAYATLQGLLISTATNGVNSELILYVDGVATALNIQSYDNNATTGIAQISLSGRALISGLSAGNHTFAVYGTSTYGAQADNVSIQVQPV